jgi:hypothetical protein
MYRHRTQGLQCPWSLPLAPGHGIARLNWDTANIDRSQEPVKRGTLASGTVRNDWEQSGTIRNDKIFIPIHRQLWCSGQSICRMRDFENINPAKTGNQNNILGAYRKRKPDLLCLHPAKRAGCMNRQIVAGHSILVLPHILAKFGEFSGPCVADLGAIIALIAVRLMFVACRASIDSAHQIGN